MIILFLLFEQVLNFVDSVLNLVFVEQGFSKVFRVSFLTSFSSGVVFMAPNFIGPESVYQVRPPVEGIGIFLVSLNDGFPWNVRQI